MEISNDIPFRNLSRKDAEQHQWSPYAQFCQALMHYRITHIKTGESWTKGELFIEYGDSPLELRMIKERIHPDFKFTHKDEQ